jgi:hypothetical protein
MQATEFLNATDPAPYRSISDLDRMHHLVLTGVWELPFGKGKKFGNGLPRPVEFLAGGWQLNGVVQRQSGPPLGFGDVWTLFTGNTNNLVLPKDKRSVDEWFNVDAGFNRNSAQQQHPLLTPAVQRSSCRWRSALGLFRHQAFPCQGKRQSRVPRRVPEFIQSSEPVYPEHDSHQHGIRRRHQSGRTPFLVLFVEAAVLT